MVGTFTCPSIPYNRKSKHKDDTSFTGVDLSLRDRSMVVSSNKKEKEVEEEKSSDNHKNEGSEGFIEEAIRTSSEYEDEIYYADIDASPITENSIYGYNLPHLSLNKNLKAELHSHKNGSLSDSNNNLDKDMNKFLIYNGISNKLSTASPIKTLQSFLSKQAIETSNNDVAENNPSNFNVDTIPYSDFRDDLNVLSASQAKDCLNSAEEIKKKENDFNDVIPTLMLANTKQKVEDYLNSTEPQQRYPNIRICPPMQSLNPLYMLTDSRSTHKDILNLKPEEFVIIRHVDSVMENRFSFKKINIMMISLLAFNFLAQILAILLYILNILPESIEFIHLFFFCLALNFFMFFSILVHQGQLRLTDNQW